jgi:hypothetical protein
MPALYNVLCAVLALSAVAVTSPIEGSRVDSRAPDPVPIPQDTNGVSSGSSPVKSRVYPELYTIFPQIPDSHRPPVGGIHLEAYQNRSQVEQVALFTGIPTTARNCILGLHVADKPNRVFVASLKGPTFTESHVTNIHLMTGFPPNKTVSFNSIQGLYNETQRIGAFDFSNWDLATIGEKLIGYYPTPCAQQLSFRLSLRQLVEEKSVYLQQNEQNGYYVEYES